LKNNKLSFLPKELLDALSNIEGFDKTGFEGVHQAALPPVSVRLNAAKQTNERILEYQIAAQVPWCGTGRYLQQRPVFTLDPLLHAGAYYVQEASSMFIEQAILHLGLHNIPLTALDVCAAPGGKSSHLQSLLHNESVLVCNEVIANRNAVLQENLTKWGGVNTIITQNDPVQLGQLGPCFDLILTDAPCSGSGLFRRDPDAINEWSTAAVNLCSQRQQRILADVLPCLKPGGILIYATCSYSVEEDEAIADWLIDEQGMQPVPLSWPNGQHGVVIAQSPKANATCYRFFPNLVAGEGFFMAIFRKNESILPKDKAFSLPKKEKLPEQMHNWFDTTKAVMPYRHVNTWFAMQANTLNFFMMVQKKLYVKKAGVAVAQEAGKDLIPEHAFAVSQIINTIAFEKLQLNNEAALQYLRKQELDINFSVKGWHLIQYMGYSLGWVKWIGNRFNNYYPKEWRIKMV